MKRANSVLDSFNDVSDYGMPNNSNARLVVDRAKIRYATFESNQPSSGNSGISKKNIAKFGMAKRK